MSKYGRQRRCRKQISRTHRVQIRPACIKVIKGLSSSGRCHRRSPAATVKGPPGSRPHVPPDPVARRSRAGRTLRGETSGDRAGRRRPSPLTDIDAGHVARGGVSVALCCRRVTKISTARRGAYYVASGGIHVSARRMRVHACRVLPLHVTFKCAQRRTLGSTFDDNRPSVQPAPP